MSAVSSEVAAVPVKKKTGIRWRRVALHVFLFTMALVWLFPLVYAVYTSLRPYAGHRPARVRLDRRVVQLRQLRQGLHRRRTSRRTSSTR